MEHKPSEYTCVINFNYQQLCEVRKAITDRIIKLFESSNEDYPYRKFDLSTLDSISELIDKHIDIAVNQWEEQVAKVEAELLDSELELKEFFFDE